MITANKKGSLDNFLRGISDKKDRLERLHNKFRNLMRLSNAENARVCYDTINDPLYEKLKGAAKITEDEHIRRNHVMGRAPYSMIYAAVWPWFIYASELRQEIKDRKMPEDIYALLVELSEDQIAKLLIRVGDDTGKSERLRVPAIYEGIRKFK